jgi:hypothetical protein
MMCETPMPAAAAGDETPPYGSISSSAPVVKVAAALAAVPEWFQGWDEGQHMYYYFNSTSQQSIWEPPQGAPFVPHAGPTPGLLDVALPVSSPVARDSPPSMAIEANMDTRSSPLRIPSAQRRYSGRFEPADEPPVEAAPLAAAAAALFPAAGLVVLPPGVGQQLLRKSMANESLSSALRRGMQPESKHFAVSNFRALGVYI